MDYQPLVHRLCRRYSGSGEPLDDLLQVGTIGLIKAIAKFDAARGNSFITYAVPVIVGEIKNYLRDNGWAIKMPRKLQSHRLAVRRAVGSLGHRLGRAPTVSELAEETDLSHQQVMDTFGVENYGRPLSLQTEYTNGDGSTDTSLIDRVGSWDPEFELSIDKIDLDHGFRCLSKREKTIIHLKFYGGLTQMEIAGRLHISQMHVSRLQRRALAKLRDAMDRRRSEPTPR
jgi:RNA polymerase sigma-B factor